MDTGVCFLTETKRSKAKWSLGGIRRADGKWRMLDNHDETLRGGKREVRRERGSEGRAREREKRKTLRDSTWHERPSFLQDPRDSLPMETVGPGMVLLTLRDGVTACRRKHR